MNEKHKKVFKEGRADFTKKEMRDLIFEIPKDENDI